MNALVFSLFTDILENEETLGTRLGWETTSHGHKINMSEDLMVNIISDGSRGGTQRPRPFPPLFLTKLRLEGSFKNLF